MTLHSGKLEVLFQTIQEIVNTAGPWKEKRDQIREEAKDDPEWAAAFEEFTSWFNEEGEGP